MNVAKIAFLRTNPYRALGQQPEVDLHSLADEATREDLVVDALLGLLLHMETLRNAFEREKTSFATETRKCVEETSATIDRLVSDLLSGDAGPPGHVM